LVILNNHDNIINSHLKKILVSILVVDDARFMRVILKEILESTIPSVDVVEADNTTSTIEMYNKEKPDLVTMNMNLPVTDGITCMKYILKVNPRAKVLMVSVVDQQNLMSDAMNSGVLEYINKPFNKIEVISKVKELLN